MGTARIRFSGGPYDGKVIDYGPVRPPRLYFQRCERGRWRTFTYLLGPGNIYHWRPDDFVEGLVALRQHQEHPVGEVVGPTDHRTPAAGDQLAAVDGDDVLGDVRVPCLHKAHTNRCG